MRAIRNPKHHVQFFSPKKKSMKSRETLKLHHFPVFPSFLLQFFGFQGDVKGFNEGTKSMVTLIKLPAQSFIALSGAHTLIEPLPAVPPFECLSNLPDFFSVKFFYPEIIVKSFQKCVKIINRIPKSSIKTVFPVDIVVVNPFPLTHAARRTQAVFVENFII